MVALTSSLLFEVSKLPLSLLLLFSSHLPCPVQRQIQLRMLLLSLARVVMLDRSHRCLRSSLIHSRLKGDWRDVLKGLRVVELDLELVWEDLSRETSWAARRVYCRCRLHQTKSVCAFGGGVVILVLQACFNLLDDGDRVDNNQASISERSLRSSTDAHLLVDLEELRCRCGCRLCCLVVMKRVTSDKAIYPKMSSSSSSTNATTTTTFSHNTPKPFTQSEA